MADVRRIAASDCQRVRRAMLTTIGIPFSVATAADAMRCDLIRRVRGALTGIATFVGGTFHALPFLIDDTQTALKIAYVAVGMELITIAWVRRRFLQVALHRSLVHLDRLVAAGPRGDSYIRWLGRSGVAVCA